MTRKETYNSMKKEIVDELLDFAFDMHRMHEIGDEVLTSIALEPSLILLMKNIGEAIDITKLSENEMEEFHFHKWTQDDHKKYLPNTPLLCLNVTGGMMLIPRLFTGLIPVGTKLLKIDGQVIKYDGINLDFHTYNMPDHLPYSILKERRPTDNYE